MDARRVARRQRFVNDVDELANRLDHGLRPGLEQLEHIVGELGGPVDRFAHLLLSLALELVGLPRGRRFASRLAALGLGFWHEDASSLEGRSSR